MVPPFVKKFDFRGIYNKDITDSDAYFIALALQKILPLKKVLVGWDTRPSSKNLAYHFISALSDKQIDIFYLEKCPIDYVTAAAFTGDFDLSVMMTGSHNPQNWTGLLLHTRRGDSIEGEMVSQIIDTYYDVQKQGFEEKQMDLEKFIDYTPAIESIYTEKIRSLLPTDQINPLKILVDIGDGSGSKSLTLLEKLLPQVTFDRLNDRGLYDENSLHVADPSDIRNMRQLINEMKKGEYDGGFAFDSDADRVLGVDETGEYLNGSLLGSAMSEIFIKQKLDEHKFGYAVDCGPSMHNALLQMSKENQLTIQPIPVGRSIMRRMIREGNIDFAVENVGHFYCKDFFMTDSGAFSLVAILYWTSLHGKLSQIKTIYPDGVRKQLFIPVSEKDTIEHVSEIIEEHFKNAPKKKIIVDGLRMEIYEGEKIKSWFAVRKSGYEAIEKYYYGSTDAADFSFLEKTIQENVEISS